MPAADGARCDASPAFLPARPINQADLAALTERVHRRVIRWFRMQRRPPPTCSPGRTAGFQSTPVCGSRSSTATCRAIFRAWSTCCGTYGGRACHGGLLRRNSRDPKAPLARHVSDCLGQADGSGGGGVSTCVPYLRWRHPPLRRRPAGAGSLRTGGSQAGEGQNGFARVKSAPHTPRRAARASADARKTPPKRVRGVSRHPLRTPGPLLPRLTSRSSAGRPLRKCH